MTPDNPLAKISRVLVGSANPAKCAAVRSALAHYVGPECEVVGIEVESGVPEQPVGFDEIARGAQQRATAAFAAGRGDLAVGIEDGLVRIAALGRDALNIGAAAVTDGVRVSVGLSSGFAYPPGCAEPAIADRVAIGDLFDPYFEAHGAAAATVRAGGSVEPSARGEGNIGRLTFGALPRADYGRHAVLCALVRFLHPSLYAEPVAGERGGFHA